MELDADGQGRDNGSNLFVRFLGQVARRIIFCPISIKRWNKMPKDNTKRLWELIEKNFEFDYAACVKWALRTLGDRWKAHKYNLQGKYFFLNNRKAEILAANPSNIPPVEWTAFVDHYMDPKKKLIVSYASGSKSNVRRATQMDKKLGRHVCRSEEKIAYHLPKDQERAATEAHPDDAIRNVCSLENGKRVRDFSNAACSSGFGKSKRIFGGAICEHAADLERQLQEAKDQVATLHRFLQQKYSDEVPTFSDYVPHIQSN
ncbi:hypothetical protein Ahy_Scaffold6g107985 [Arachis hypogaea]|uniref:Uncharacterized protein n=1 Tax=Arachis hypogaea TaxID=3818 RepID=A0A444WP35_ARAHY|nr:hypothetical protein Ahy_Scaffold6g107985 [Arachis hypogaea]